MTQIISRERARLGGQAIGEGSSGESGDWRRARLAHIDGALCAPLQVEREQVGKLVFGKEEDRDAPHEDRVDVRLTPGHGQALRLEAKECPLLLQQRCARERPLREGRWGQCTSYIPRSRDHIYLGHVIIYMTRSRDHIYLGHVIVMRGGALGAVSLWYIGRRTTAKARKLGASAAFFPPYSRIFTHLHSSERIVHAPRLRLQNLGTSRYLRRASRNPPSGGTQP